MTQTLLCFASWLSFYGQLLFFELGGAPSSVCFVSETFPEPPKQTTAQQSVFHNLEPVVQVGHSGSLRDIVFSSNNKYFLTTSHDQHSDEKVILWDANSGDKLRSFSAETHKLTPSFCLDSRAVVIGGNVWDINTCNRLYDILRDGEVPVAARVSTDTRRLIVGTTAGKSRVIDLETGEITASFSKPKLDYPAENVRKKKTEDERCIMDVGFAKNDTPLAIMVDRGPCVSVWNVATGEKQAEFHSPDCNIDAALFSPHARYVTTRYWGDTGEPFETTRVYDLSSGKEIVVSEEWMYDRDSAKFTSDGCFYVSGTGHHKATLWDLKTGRAIHHFGNHVRPIHMIQLLDDDKVLETQSYDAAQRWDITSGKLLKTFRDPLFSDSVKINLNWPPVDPIVVPSPDGKTFFCRGRIFCEETDGLQCKIDIPKNVDHALRAVYVPGSDNLIINLDRHGVSQSILFDTATGKAVKQLAFSPLLRHGLQWNRNASRALTLSNGLNLLWDVKQGRLLQTIGTVQKNEDGSVSKEVVYPAPDISFSANGKFVYSHGRQWGAFFWNAQTGEAMHHGPPSQGTTGKDGLVDFPLPIGVNKDEQVQGLANEQGLVDGRKYCQYYKGRSVLSSDHRFLASWYSSWHSHPGDPGDRSTKILVWNVEKGSLLQMIDLSDMLPSFTPFFSPDGKYLAIASKRKDGSMAMWDTESWKRLYLLTQRGDIIVQFTPDSRKMLVNSGGRELALHDVKTGKLIHRMVDVQPALTAVGPESLWENALLSPDYKYMVADYGSKYAIVWNLQSGKQILLIRRDMGHVPLSNVFSFSDDGRRLLTLFRPPTLWSLESGEVSKISERECKAGLRGFSRPHAAKPVVFADLTPVPDEIFKRFGSHIPKNVSAVEWTADRSVFIIYHDNGCMDLWDISGEKPICSCYQFENGSHWLTIAPDGRCYGNLEYVRYRKPGTIEIEATR